MVDLFLKVLAAYLIGNVMGGDLMGRLRGGVDLRKQGSGNIGATNALRTQGKGFALAVLLIDVAKGVVAAGLLPRLSLGDALDTFDPVCEAFACGFAVALGHCYPAFHQFQGGKAVATLAGVFAVLLPEAMGWILGAFVLVTVLTGYVALASITASWVAVAYVTGLDPNGLQTPAGAFTLAMALLMLWRHRANVGRLLRGEEHRFDKARILHRWLKR